MNDADIPGRLRCTAGIHPHLNVDAKTLLNDAADYIDELEKNLRTITRIAAEIKIDSGGT